MPAPQFSAPTTEARDRAIPEVIRAAADRWETQVVIDSAQHAPKYAGIFLRCSVCSQAVLRLSYSPRGLPQPDEVGALRITAQALQDAVLAHVLQVHRPEVDPEWSGT